MMYEKAQAFTNEVNVLLNNIEGQPKELCPYDRDVEGSNGYHFIRTDDYRNGYCIFITKGDFSWTISIEYEGVLWKKGNKVNITGYYHFLTNYDFNLDNFKEALQNTMQFFPRVNPPNYKIRSESENLTSLFLLFKRLLKSEILFDYGEPSSEDHVRYYVWFKDEKLHDKTKKRGEVETQTLISSLKIVYPSITIEEKLRKNGDVGFEILRKKIPAILAASDELKSESKTAKKYGTNSLALKWLAAKAIWKNPNVNLTSLPNELAEVTYVARKFTI